MPSKASLTRRVATQLLVLAGLLVFLFAAPAAQAAFPGANGKIAFASDRDGDLEIYTMNADGTAVMQLTHNAVIDSQPAWSADGRKIAFTRRALPNSNGEIWVMNADGSAQTRIVLPPAVEPFGGQNPTWSPDGRKIAFANLAPPSTASGGIWVMNADGSGGVKITGSGCTECGDGVDGPAWGPGGQKIAFHGNECCFPHIYTINSDGSEPALISPAASRPNWSPDGAKIAFNPDPNDAGGIYTMNPDGSGRTALTTAETDLSPAWSPDGAKIAFARAPSCCAFWDIYTMNRDGTNQTQLTSGPASDIDPDWQPIPPPPDPYPRPNGAAKMRVALLPAFKQCTNPDSTHGEPLSLESCKSFEQTSAVATVPNDDSSRASGHMVFRFVCTNGGIPPSCGAPGDQADVDVSVSFSDVREKLAPVLDYNGQMLASFGLRITDTDNGPSRSRSATVSDATVSVVVPCTPTPEAGPLPLGSTCSVDTRLDAVIPGVVEEDHRAIWELEQVQLYDSGPDDDPLTAGDNTLFAVQGVFVP